MPPVRMTRAEYEATYGVQPKIATSSLDNDPIPVRMTRAEYNAIYRPQPVDTGIGADLRAGFEGAKQAVERGVQREAELQNRGFLSRQFGRFTSGLQAAGEALGSVGEGVFRALPGGTTVANVAGNLAEQGILAVAESRPGQVTQAGFQALPESVQTFASDVGRGTIGALGIGGALVAPGANSAIGRTVVSSADDAIRNAATRTARFRADSRINKVADEIASIENNYAKTRQKIDRDPFVNESRQRIAQSNVLQGAVDEDGLIRTKQKGGAIDQYKNTPITDDGLTLLDVEDVVRRNLQTEGRKVNLNELRTNIFGAVMDSGLEGADLAAAIRRVDKDLQGLAIRADEFGDVLLEKIQDAKISTTKNIDYSKPVGTTYRKTLARVYKETIEDKSALPVKEWNTELAKYYRDIDRLADLDGKRVKGGRLGRYTAQIVGTGVGAAGGTVGGGTGALLGGVIGGEIASTLKGKAMARTFGRGEGQMPQSSVLATAQARALSGARDLKTPDRPVGVNKSLMADPNMPESVKTQIVQVEGQIKKNIQQQKAAIKAGDFDLVSALKDVYQSLVERLKQIIDEYKKMSPADKQGGFFGQRPEGFPQRNNDLMSDQNQANAAPATIQNISDTVDPDRVTVKADVEDDILMENLMRLDPVEADPMDFDRITELKRTAEQRALTEEELLDAQRIVEDTQGPLPEADIATPNLADDIAKAKAEGKTFDEWVKTQGTPLYHGTTKESASKIAKQGFKEGKNASELGRGVYLTSDKTPANLFGNQGEVIEAFAPNLRTYELPDFNLNPSGESVKIAKEIIDRNALPLTLKGMDVDELADRIRSVWSTEDARFWLEKAGYDGITDAGSQIRGQIVVFDPKKIKTRSQLKAEWDKVK